MDLWKERNFIFFFSRSSLQRWKKGPARRGGGRKAGRPRALAGRPLRAFFRHLKKARAVNKNVGLRGLVVGWKRQGMGGEVGERSFYRYCAREGYSLRAVMRKGILSPGDRVQRERWARSLLPNGAEYWKRVCFFLDCVSFLYKRNPAEEASTPKGRVWMKKVERLQLSGKSKNIGVGGRMLHVCVAISFGRGVVVCEPYERLTGERFAGIVEKVFPPCGYHPTKLFVQDNCPAQNARVAVQAIARAGFTQVKIPPRSPDCNPIENLFAWVKQRLRAQALEEGIEKETFLGFEKRVLDTLRGVGREHVDRLILSMPKRLDKILGGRGERLLY